jgi:K+/H+ antiporter YhaU regulatory subunit KhtT
VAIYREGKHIANPAPDLELHSHDVLVFLGDKEQLAAARRLLLPH